MSFFLPLLVDFLLRGSPSFHLFMNHMDSESYFILYVIITCCHYLFDVWIVPDWPSGSPFGLVLVLLTCLHHVFEHFFTFCYKLFICASPAAVESVSDSFEWRILFIKQDLIFVYARCYSALLSTDLGNFVHTHTYIHVHMPSYLFLYLTIYTYIKNYEFT